MKLILEPGREAGATPTPQNLYTLAGLQSGTVVQVQNTSSGILHVYCGPSEPESLDDYFQMEPSDWHSFSGAVLYAWARKANTRLIIDSGNGREFASSSQSDLNATLLAAYGTVNTSNNAVLRIGIPGATGGTKPYSNWRVLLSFLHPDQGGRTILLTGEVLNIAPTSVTDSASIFDETTTGIFIGPNNTLIGGVLKQRGDTVNGINGNLNNLELVSSIADLYGDINISISVDDTDNNTAQVTL